MADDFDVKAFIRKYDRPNDFDPKEFIRKYGGPSMAAAPPPDAMPPQDPTEQMFVSREAYTDPRPFGQKGSEVGEGIVKGTITSADTNTFGLANRGIAYGRALADTASGAPMDYAKKIAEQNEFLKRLREENPDRAMAADLAGGLVGGLGMTKAGLTLVKPGMGFIKRAIAGGTEGALQAGAQAAGQSYGTVGEKLTAAKSAALMGGILGTSVPLAITGASGAKTLYDITKGNIPYWGSPAMLRAAEADRAALQNLPSMGPNAALVDTPSMRALGAGAATTPGYGKTELETMLKAREKTTPLRLREGTTEHFGPDVIPSHTVRDLKEAAKEIGPEWEQAFKNAKAVDTKDVADWLEGMANDLPGAAGALDQVRKGLFIRGTEHLDPYAGKLHQVRRMVGGMLEDKDLDSVTAGALKQTYRRITEELHAKVPDMPNLDARTAEVKNRLAAYERGMDLFDRHRPVPGQPGGFVRPVEWAEEKAAMAGPMASGPRATVQGPSAAPKFSEMGTRSEVERMVSTGSNNLNKLEKTFDPHLPATENLITQFGIKNVEDFQRMLATNREFRDSYTAIVKGSQTANKMEAAADTERGYDAIAKFIKKPVTLVGDALERAQQGFGASVRNRITHILAQQGPEMEVLRRELLDAAAEQARKDLTRTMVESALRRSATGTVPRAIGP